MVEGMQIRATDATGQCLDQNLAILGLWLLDLVNDKVTVPEYRCTHCTSSG
jgi:hypothetical protein